MFFLFFKQKTAYEMRISDWSSDVCSSDLNDKNVLPFRIDYINTIKAGAAIHDKQVSAIDTERALLAPERISQVAGYIREHFDQKTKRSASYRHGGKRQIGRAHV